MQLLHLQIFSERTCHDIFREKLTNYFGLIVYEGCIKDPASIFSSRYCVYVLMETFMSVMVDLEVIDKRETK